MKTTSLCYLEKDDCYLMLYRNKKKNDPNEGKWIGVGGHCLDNETIDACMKREVYEETGYQIKFYTYHGIITFESDVHEKEVMHLYTSNQFFGTEIKTYEGTLVWVKKSDIHQLNLWAGDKIFLDLLADKKAFFNLKLVYQKDILIRHGIIFT